MSDASARVAFVMAGSKGLGLGSAIALGQAGYQVVICSRQEQSVQKTVQDLSAQGITAAGVVADVAQAADLQRAFSYIEGHYGRLDALVANAGGPPPGTFESVSEESWSLAFELTLMSAVRSIRLALPLMKRNGFGRIIVIGSSSARQPIEGLVLSNAFRPALVGVVKTLAREVAAQGITVNMVAPGRIDTDRVRQLDENRARNTGASYEQVRAESERQIPVGRYGSPADLGALVGFLCSEAASYITGQTLMVDGGLLSALP